MGVAASAASSPPEAAAPADPQAKEGIRHAAAADAPADPPAKEPATATDAPPEAAAPADSPAKEEIQSAAAADAPGGDAEAAGETVVFDAAAEAGGEEEEAECGFCLYMKGGGCKDEFVEWEKCLEEAQEKGADVVEHCAQVTVALRSCMLVHEEYYEPILRVERRMSEDLEGAEAEASQAEQGDNEKQAEEEVVVVVEEKEDVAA